MINLKKTAAVSFQRKKPWKKVKLLQDVEFPYFLYDYHRLAEASASGLSPKYPMPLAKLAFPLMAIGVSASGVHVTGLTQDGKLFIWNRLTGGVRILSTPSIVKAAFTTVIKAKDKQFKVALTGPPISLNESGDLLVIISPDEQIWLWTAQRYLRYSKTPVSDKVTGTWIQITGESITELTPDVMNASARSHTSQDSRTSFSSSKSSLVATTYTPGSGVDVSFASNDIEGQLIKILRVWIKSAGEEQSVLETCVTQVQISKLLKGGNDMLQVGDILQQRYQGEVDYWNKEGSERESLLVRYDHTGSLAAIAISSMHMYMCHLVFYSPQTKNACSRRLFQYITGEDMPNPDEQGHNALWMDDICWSDDDLYLAAIFRFGSFMIISRLGEPLILSMEVVGRPQTPHMFVSLYFTTPPDKWKRYGKKHSVQFVGEKLLLSDGYTLNVLEVKNYLTLKELTPLLLPSDQEAHDISINISHETNPLPSEMDSGPRRFSIDKAVLLLRTSLSLRHNTYEALVFDQVTSWLDSVLPPALHDEINYTVVNQTAEILDTNAKLNSNLILKKKMKSVEVYTQLRQVLSCLKWSPLPAIEYKEWSITLVENVFKYMLADGEALFAYNVLVLSEHMLDCVLHKLRAQLLLYALVQYKNHQANHINVLYFVLAFIVAHGKHPATSDPIINAFERNCVRRYLKETVDALPPESVGDELSPPEDCEFFSTPCFYFPSGSKDRIHFHYNCLMGTSMDYEEGGEKICKLLISGNLKEAESLVTEESLFLLAYYYDTKYGMMISPVEYESLDKRKYRSLEELFAQVIKLSTVPVVKSSKKEKETAFLYWTLGLMDRLEDYLPPQVLFQAVCSMLQELTKKEVLDAIQLLRSLFLKHKPDQLCMLYLSPPYLQPILKIEGLSQASSLLLDYIHTLPALHIPFPDSDSQSLLAQTLFKVELPDDIVEAIKRGFSLLGQAMINKKRGTSQFWLLFDLGDSMEGKMLANKAQKMVDRFISLTWYLKLRSEFSRKQREMEGHAWALRLLPFNEFHSKTQLLDVILNMMYGSTEQIADLVSLYLYENDIPRQLDAKLSRWKTFLSQKSPRLCEQLLSSMKQPPKRQPWLNDPEFFQFIDSLIQNIPVVSSSPAELIRKKWGKIIQRYRKQFRIAGRVIFEDSHFHLFEGEDWDITQALVEMVDISNTEAGKGEDELEDHEPVTKPLTMPEQVKFVAVPVQRLTNPSFKSPRRALGQGRPVSVYRRLGLEKMAGVMKTLVRKATSRFFKRKAVKKPPVPQPSSRRSTPQKGHRRQLSMPSIGAPILFMSVKCETPEAKQFASAKPLQLSITQIRDSEPSSNQHRRSASCSAPSSPNLSDNKPFQLIRIPRSNSVKKMARET